ncbi:DUF1631 family protein [Paracidovorax valerianellae]|uniref:DUF1631 family protein n=1 Tax=Paracidovorax valerianellae TaxID=187868 RepID=A0A1G6YDH0_9BURK|nr:DUF1631 family protein [Paracidovorax valerianellae]MDA8445787.1 DUF1631 domain-containing protein [Paracidovorax valerianellae]SDD88410.1 Protein of unknown function [Paracidovorax valerianellae]
MSLSASRSRTVFRACVVNAVRQGEALMGRLTSVTQGALASDESNERNIQQRTVLADAMRLIKQHEDTLAKAYPMALLEVFAEGPAPSSARARSGDETGIDFGELSLMDESEVLAQVELSRAQQIAVHATEATLAELNTLVSSAQGLQRVQPERNPLRPENYIRALQQVVGETGVSAEIRQVWMAHMRKVLGDELVAVYKAAAQSLRDNGIAPVGYAVAGQAGQGMGRSTGYGGAGHPSSHGGGYGPQSSMHGSPMSGYGGPNASQYGSPYASQYASQYGGMGGGGGGPVSMGVPLAPEAEEALLTVGMLRQMLASSGDALAYGMAPAAAFGAVPSSQQGAWVEARNGGPVSSQMGPGGSDYFPPSSAAAAEAMEDIAQLERLVGRLAGSQPAALAPWAGAGGAPMAVHGVAPVVAVPAPAPSPSRTATEVVSRMMDNIAQDNRLPQPIQRAVQNLRPAIKQLVRHDRRFFTDEKHPARRLLDELTQRAVGFESESDPGFDRFMRLVDEAVSHLATSESQDADTFATVLTALESAWASQERQIREAQEAERQAALRVQRREALSKRIAADIRALAGAAQVPQDILDFAAGPWADVVALAQMDQPGSDDGDPGGYLALVPELFWVAQPDLAAAEPDRLGGIVTRMLGTVRQGLDSVGHAEDMASTVLERIASLHQTAMERAASLALDPANAPADEPDSMETIVPPESLYGSLHEPGVADESETTQSGADAAAAEFPMGIWVELISNQRAVHTQLTWCSPHNTLFLFTAADGSTQSMTRRMRDKLTAEGALRVLPGPPPSVVAQARAQRGSKGAKAVRPR